MIHKRYIDEAIRIRKDYLNELDTLLSKEKKILKYKDNIEIIMLDINTFIDNLDTDLTEEELNEKLKDELNDLENNINIIQDDVKILDKKIKKLKNASHELYISIVKKYPKLTADEIKKEVFYSLKQ